MYNKTYVNSFEEDNYLTYLIDNNKLKDISTNYINRYNRGVEVRKLAFKDSLDHYIVKKISENPNYMNTMEFKNYIKYIREINTQKNYIIGQKTIHPELSTNIIFEYLSEEDLKSLFPNDNIKKEIEENNYLINDIFNKIKNNQNIDLEELEFISDYLDNKKDLDNSKYTEYISYIFENKDKLNMTPKICSALLTYIPKVYGSEVKSSRTYLGSTDGNLKIKGAHSSNKYPYVCFNYDIFKDVDINSFESVNKSRTFKNKDIMFLIYVASHELTHQKQNNDIVNGKKFDGAMKEIDDILVEGNGLSDYERNHDACEIEMDADENGWKNCAIFASKFIKDEEIAQKCRKNSRDVNLRRAFSLKRDENGNSQRYIDYDIEQIRKIIKNNPEILKKHKNLSQILDEKGRIKTDFLFEKMIANTKAGRSLCNYTLNKVPTKLLKEKINSGKYTPSQINTLLENFAHVPHENCLTLRGLKDVDFKTFSETNTGVHGGKDTVLFDIYNNYFVECSAQLMKFDELLNIASNKFPKDFNDKVINDYFKFFTNYYVELAKNIDAPNDFYINEILEKFENSDSERLQNLAKYTFNYFKNEKNVDLTDIINGQWFRTPQLNDLSIKSSKKEFDNKVISDAIHLTENSTRIGNIKQQQQQLIDIQNQKNQVNNLSQDVQK